MRYFLRREGVAGDSYFVGSVRLADGAVLDAGEHIGEGFRTVVMPCFQADVAVAHWHAARLEILPVRVGVSVVRRLPVRECHGVYPPGVLCLYGGLHAEALERVLVEVDTEADVVPYLDVAVIDVE